MSNAEKSRYTCCKWQVQRVLHIIHKWNASVYFKRVSVGCAVSDWCTFSHNIYATRKMSFN